MLSPFNAATLPPLNPIYGSLREHTAAPASTHHHPIYLRQVNAPSPFLPIPTKQRAPEGAAGAILRFMASVFIYIDF